MEIIDFLQECDWFRRGGCTVREAFIYEEPCLKTSVLDNESNGGGV